MESPVRSYPEATRANLEMSLELPAAGCTWERPIRVLGHPEG